jgi:predicted small metal-binding protein
MEKEARSKKMELSKYCAAIIEDYVQGRLVKEDQSSEMEKLRMEKLKEEIRYLKIKNDFAENFDKPISNSATRILKPVITTNNEIINGVSPYDANNKRLQCTDCGVLLTWNSFETYLQQIKEYKNHILSRHNRELSAIEKDVINNLKYEGKSK